MPDPRCTPGALNPAVTQATINQTICVSGYTKTIRPAESITEAEKRASMAAYGDTDSMSGFEYDHLVSLELGGAANDMRNLWPEPGASPNPKDSVEDELHRLVCSGQIPCARPSTSSSPAGSATPTATSRPAGRWRFPAHAHPAYDGPPKAGDGEEQLRVVTVGLSRRPPAPISRASTQP